MEDLLELDTILLFRRFVAWQMSQLHGEGPARDAYLGLSLSWKELRCEGEKALHDQSLVVSEDELFELFALQHMALVQSAPGAKPQNKANGFARRASVQVQAARGKMKEKVAAIKGDKVPSLTTAAGLSAKANDNDDMAPMQRLKAKRHQVLRQLRDVYQAGISLRTTADHRSGSPSSPPRSRRSPPPGAPAAAATAGAAPAAAPPTERSVGRTALACRRGRVRRGPRVGGRPRLDGRLRRVGRAAVAVGAPPPSGPAVQEVAARAARGGRAARGIDCGGCTRGRDAGAYAHPARVRPPARLVRRAAPRHLAAADRAHPHRRRRRRPFGRAAARAVPSRLRAARIRALAHAPAVDAKLGAGPVSIGVLSLASPDERRRRAESAASLTLRVAEARRRGRRRSPDSRWYNNCSPSAAASSQSTVRRAVAGGSRRSLVSATRASSRSAPRRRGFPNGRAARRGRRRARLQPAPLPPPPAAAAAYAYGPTPAVRRPARMRGQPEMPMASTAPPPRRRRRCRRRRAQSAASAALTAGTPHAAAASAAGGAAAAADDPYASLNPPCAAAAAAGGGGDDDDDDGAGRRARRRRAACGEDRSSSTG